MNDIGRYIWDMHQYNIYTTNPDLVLPDGEAWTPTHEGDQPPF
jgi:hypothetical protein